MATIQKRRNSYRIMVSAGYTAEGKQLRKGMTWTPAPGMTEKQTQKELERQAVLFEEKVKSGLYLDGNIRFQDFAERWFRDYAEGHLRERTLDRYRGLTERTYQAIGHIRIDRLQPHHLLEFYAQLAAEGQNQRTGGGLAPKTIRHYHCFISSIMERAVKWQMVQENPCRRIDAPKVDRHEVECMNDEEAVHFLECLDAEPLEYRTIFTLLLLTGMRRGELLGLEWPDVDFATGDISIRRTSQYTAKKGIFTDTTKTESSKRSVRVSVEVLDLLREYQSWQNERRLKLGDRWQECGRLFTQWDGRPMSLNTPYLMLQKVLERHGLRKVSLHSLRHTNATLMLMNGNDVRTVAGRLGHSQTSTTMNIYAHLFQSAEEGVSESLSDTLLRKKKRALSTEDEGE